MAFRNPITTVAVSGTVTTATAGGTVGTGGTGGTSATYRDVAVASTPSGGGLYVSTPAKTVTGDLLILTVVQFQNTAAPSVSGWTQRASIFGTRNAAWVYSRLATASDAGGGNSYYVGSLSNNGSSFVSIVAIANATTVTQPSGSTTTSVGPSASASVALGTTSLNALVFTIIFPDTSAGSVANGMTWPSSGGPPAPQPSWTTPVAVADPSNGGAVTISCAPVTWSTGSYSDLFVNNTNAYRYVSNLLAA